MVLTRIGDGYRRLALVAVLAALMSAVSPGAVRAVDGVDGDDPSAESTGNGGVGDGFGAFVQVLGEAETRYVSYGRKRNRAHNLALAAERIDGAILAPGAELSFNEVVGHRTAENGFRPAPVLASGRVRMGMGGGICQTATTLHLAALRAGLEPVEHRPHSRPSHYVGEGLDATVVDGRFDYRVRNPHDFAVRVHAKAEDGRLLVVINGTRRGPRLEVRSVVLRELPAPERREADASLPAGIEEIDRPGRDGVVVRVDRLAPDGTVVDSHRVRYDPAPRVVRVGA